MTRKIIVVVTLLMLSRIGSAQQVADSLFDPVILKPRYPQGTGPVMLIDEAHHNFHTLDGRYMPFAKVLTKDGYVVNRHNVPFSSTSLQSARIIVIANALHESNAGKWSLPTPSAFTNEEIDALNMWVKNGGSLFLIADHMPFPGAADKLAGSFGFKFVNGFAIGNEVFKIDDGLRRNTITTGTNPSENIHSVRTFTGSAFEIPIDAQPILTLNDKYKIKIPETAWVFNKNTPVKSGEGLYQGAYLKYGQGRVVVFGEAAMFTAQRQGKSKVGMNSRDAEQNLQLLLNTIHWLDDGK